MRQYTNIGWYYIFFSSVVHECVKKTALLMFSAALCIMFNWMTIWVYNKHFQTRMECVSLHSHDWTWFIVCDCKTLSLGHNVLSLGGSDAKSLEVTIAIWTSRLHSTVMTVWQDNRHRHANMKSSLIQYVYTTSDYWLKQTCNTSSLLAVTVGVNNDLTLRHSPWEY